MQAESKWGGAFFETLSEDLKKMFPGAKGFSTTNLRYMKRYYNLFGEILPQLGAELPEATNLPQVGAEIYAIPWGHIKLIVDKCKDEPEKAMFFVDEVIKNNSIRCSFLCAKCLQFRLKEYHLLNTTSAIYHSPQMSQPPMLCYIREQ